MKVTEHLARASRPLISFELIPPLLCLAKQSVFLGLAGLRFVLLPALLEHALLFGALALDRPQQVRVGRRRILLRQDGGNESNGRKGEQFSDYDHDRTSCCAR